MWNLLRRLGYGGVTPSMAARPSRLRASTTTPVVFTGSGTSWLSSPPSLSGSGVAGVSAGAAEVTGDAEFVVPVTTGSATGTITWTEATYGLEATQVVGGTAVVQMLRPRPTPRRSRRG